MKQFFLSAAFSLIFFVTLSQNSIDLNTASAYRELPSSWKFYGDVSADLSATNSLKTKPGNSILVNTSSDAAHGADIYTLFEHGDADVEFDFMVAKNANSGVYLQGRYEVQIFDTWGRVNASASDNGGIYQRWDETKPDGQKGFEGYAPRQSVSRAPGTWQHMKISFEAPRFEGGKKIKNAKFSRVELNGVLIHENVDLSGGTRGANVNEQPKGPIRFQGDHGSVAFRNIRLTPFDDSRPQIENLRFYIYNGVYKKEPEYKDLTPGTSGLADIITIGANHLPDTFLLRYTADLKIAKAGEYVFNITTANGKGLLRINNTIVTALSEENKTGKITLPEGTFPFELIYSKVQSWGDPLINVSVSGPGFRQYYMTDVNDVTVQQSDPILVEAQQNTVLRSFMDIGNKRVVHAVSAGSAEGIHYTYDLDNGAVVQAWRGGFLDATPMWHERGDGSSRPMGAVQFLNNIEPVLNRLNNAAQPWKKDTVNTGFRIKGYRLDKNDRPVFRYMMYGMQVSDMMQVVENNTGLRREIQVSNAPADLYARLATADNIESIGNNMFMVGDKSYYIQLNDAAGAKPVVRTSGGKMELVVPVKSKINYTVLF